MFNFKKIGILALVTLTLVGCGAKDNEDGTVSGGELGEINIPGDIDKSQDDAVAKEKGYDYIMKVYKLADDGVSFETVEYFVKNEDVTPESTLELVSEVNGFFPTTTIQQVEGGHYQITTQSLTFWYDFVRPKPFFYFTDNGGLDIPDEFMQAYFLAIVNSIKENNPEVEKITFIDDMGFKIWFDKTEDGTVVG